MPHKCEYLFQPSSVVSDTSSSSLDLANSLVYHGKTGIVFNGLFYAC